VKWARLKLLSFKLAESTGCATSPHYSSRGGEEWAKKVLVASRTRKAPKLRNRKDIYGTPTEGSQKENAFCVKSSFHSAHQNQKWDKGGKLGKQECYDYRVASSERPPLVLVFVFFHASHATA
jgi:hypothetical protein